MRFSELNKNIASLIVLLLLPVFLFGRGAAEEEKKPLNENWTLCVTLFDTSALPESQRMMGDIIVRRLVDYLNDLEYRIRLPLELGWYGDFEKNRTRSTAAKALLAKQNERAMLSFRGDPEWQYQKNIKKIDEEIKKLEEAYQKALQEEPVITEEPFLRFTDANNNGTFPSPPRTGAEYKFCKAQNADGFLAGELRSFHGRIYVDMRLYTMYTDSYPWQDNILFSIEDRDEALSEIAEGLLAALTGAENSRLSIKVKPEEAVLTINNRYAGRGAVEEMKRPPGKLYISVTAPSYEEKIIETELNPHEIAEIDVTLKPSPFASLDISAPDAPGLLVYQGALYVGKAPLTLRLPANQMEFFKVENPWGLGSSVVVPVTVFNEDKRQKENPLEDRINAFFGWDSFKNNTLVFRPGQLPNPEEKRVDKARRRYYWTWAGTWLAGSAFWLVMGTYRDIYLPAYGKNPTEDMYDRSMQFYYATLGTLALGGVAVLVEAVNIGLYLYTASEDAPRVLK